MRKRAAVGYGLAALGAGTLAVLASDRRSVGDPPADFLRRGFRRASLPTPAGRMTFYEAGEGAPLVFLHGIGGGVSSWEWSQVAPAFASERRVIVPDWVGWGGSEHPRRLLLFDDYVDSLEALLASLGAPATVVAHSLAAGFALTVAERRPELIDLLVLNTPGGGKDFSGAEPSPRPNPAEEPSALARLLYRAAFHRRTFIGGWLRQQGFFEDARVTRATVDGFLYSARQPNAASSAIPFVKGALMYDLAPFWKRLTKPSTVLWGAEESQIGPRVRARLQELRPDIPFVVIERTKAFPELERPDEVIRIVREALSSSASTRA